METSPNATSPAPPVTKTGTRAVSTAAKIPLSSVEVPEGSGLPNFFAMGQRTAAYWFFIVISMVIGAMITRKIVKDRKFTYKSEAVLIYRGGIDGPPTPDQVKGAATRTKELLLSHNSLKKIIKDCRLAPALEATGNYGPMIDGMRLKIEFKPRAGDTYSLSYEGGSAFEARLVVTKLAEALVSFNGNERRRRLKGSIEFNRAQTQKAEEKMIALQREVGLFLTEHPNIAGEQLGNGAVIKAEIRKKDPKKAARAGDDGPRAGGGKHAANPAAPGAKKDADPAVPAIDPVLIAARAAARAEQLAARKELADKSVRFTEQHPDVRAAQARVSSAEAAVAAAEAAVEAAVAAATQAPAPRPAAPTMDDPYDTPAPRPRVIAAGGPAPRPSSAPAVAADPTQLIDLDTQWSQLNRDLQVATQNYSAMAAKLFTAQLADNTDESGYAAELDLLDPASKPLAPTGAPNRSMLSVGFGISIVVGILLSIGCGLFLDDRIYASSEIDDLRVVPVIGVIPRPRPVKKASRWRLRG